MKYLRESNTLRRVEKGSRVVCYSAACGAMEVEVIETPQDWEASISIRFPNGFQSRRLAVDLGCEWVDEPDADARTIVIERDAAIANLADTHKLLSEARAEARRLTEVLRAVQDLVKQNLPRSGE